MSIYSLYTKEIKDKESYRFTHMYVFIKTRTIKNNRLKKLMFTTQENYLKVDVTIFPIISCVCDKYSCDAKCIHIKKVLSTIYKLDNLLLTYFYIPNVQLDFMNFVKDYQSEHTYIKKLKNKLRATVHNFFSDECPCCLDKLNITPMFPDLYRCHSCKKYIHSICVEKWILNNKNSTKIKKGCMYCRTDIKKLI